MKIKNALWGAILLMAACHQPGPGITPGKDITLNSKKVTVTLKDSIAVVTLYLPKRYDTTFSWIHYSDCGRVCEKQKYRFQPKTLPIIKETGYFYDRPKDSVDQFTIVHNPYISPKDRDNPNNKKFMYQFHDHKKWDVIHDPYLKTISSDTVEKIGDRYFSIIVIDTCDSAHKIYTKRVLSSTTLRSSTIDFDFELLTKNKDSVTTHFISDAKAYLRTIRF